LHVIDTLRKGEEERQVFVILGDGVFEQKLLRLIAPKLDGTGYSLTYTASPLPGRRGGKDGGL